MWAAELPTTVSPSTISNTLGSFEKAQDLSRLQQQHQRLLVLSASHPPPRGGTEAPTRSAHTVTLQAGFPGRPDPGGQNALHSKWLEAQLNSSQTPHWPVMSRV